MKRHTSREISEHADVDRLEQQIEDRLQAYCRETDQVYTERLCQRYRDLAPPERIRALKDLPTVFEGRQQFERSYEQATGEKAPDNTVGFSRKTLEPAHVETEHLQVRKTTIHERLHQLSHPAAEQLLGKELAEGIAEDLAVRELGREWDPELPRSYSRERALARKVREVCGDRAVDRAYFQGDARELKAGLERHLGKNNLQRLKTLADEPLPPRRELPD
ncbi:MAG: hypothetical protein ACQESR_03810 [Planctomycetota bacterium]